MKLKPGGEVTFAASVFLFLPGLCDTWIPHNARQKAGISYSTRQILNPKHEIRNNIKAQRTNDQSWGLPRSAFASLAMTCGQ
jgi:hypothetical protein